LRSDEFRNDEFRSDPASGLPDDVAWPDLGQQGLGLGGGEAPLGTAWDQLEQ
jgi:hypothetical protein